MSFVLPHHIVATGKDRVPSIARFPNREPLTCIGQVGQSPPDSSSPVQLNSGVTKGSIRSQFSCLARASELKRRVDRHTSGSRLQL
ncbi:hypothetical protein V2G26_010594 [Clonostachys chloroleuca]